MNYSPQLDLTGRVYGVKARSTKRMLLLLLTSPLPFGFPFFHDLLLLPNPFPIRASTFLNSPHLPTPSSTSPLEFYTAVLIVLLLLLCLGTVTWMEYVHPANDSGKTTKKPTPITKNSGNDTPCDHINTQPDPCTFYRNNDNCHVDGLIPWLEFRYCWLPTHSHNNKALSTALTTTLMAIALIIGLNSLGDTADTFFVPTLHSVATELHLSPMVAGISLVSAGSASPDILTSIASVKAGNLDLVLGALSGAVVCLSLFCLGGGHFFQLPIIATVPKSPVPNSSVVLAVTSLPLQFSWSLQHADLFVCGDHWF